MGNLLHVYGAVPPVAVTVTVVVPPLHNIASAVELDDNAVGMAMDISVEEVHPFESVATIVYVPDADAE